MKRRAAHFLETRSNSEREEEDEDVGEEEEEAEDNDEESCYKETEYRFVLFFNFSAERCRSLLSFIDPTNIASDGLS